MGHRDHGAGELLQVALEPSHGLGVEMVRGLVEQQHVGAAEQEPAQRDAPALAAGQLVDLGVRRRQAQCFHGEVHALVEVPGVRDVDPILKLGLRLENGRHLVVGQRLAELGAHLLELFEQRLASWTASSTASRTVLNAPSSAPARR